MTDQPSQPLTEQQLTGAICDAITAFQLTAQYASLQHAQMRQYLAEHLAAALAPEVNKLRAELAEYEVLNPQQCPAGKHADWLVDSEYAHACPWCQIEALKGAAVDTRQLDDQAVQILSNEGAQCGACGDEPGDRTCPDCEECRAGYVAALRAAGWAPKAERPVEADEVRQLLVHPAVWPYLETWLAVHDIALSVNHFEGDSLPTYVMTIEPAAEGAQR